MLCIDIRACTLYTTACGFAAMQQILAFDIFCPSSDEVAENSDGYENCTRDQTCMMSNNAARGRHDSSARECTLRTNHSCYRVHLRHLTSPTTNAIWNMQRQRRYAQCESFKVMLTSAARLMLNYNLSTCIMRVQHVVRRNNIFETENMSRLCIPLSILNLSHNLLHGYR